MGYHGPNPTVGAEPEGQPWPSCSLGTDRAPPRAAPGTEGAGSMGAWSNRNCGDALRSLAPVTGHMHPRASRGPALG